VGQYHVAVNLDKKQVLVPTRLGDGLKLMEFGDGGATLTALAILLAKDNGRGLGDVHAAMRPSGWSERHRGRASVCPGCEKNEPYASR
jgi:hypothetical protein